MTLNEIQYATNLIFSGARTVNKTLNIIGNFDEKYLETKNWKIDDFSNITNTWCRFYIGEIGTDPFANFLDQANILNEPTKEVIAFGVSINVSKTPIVITQQVKGFKSPIYQQFSSNSYDIDITFRESGVVWWQQNSKQIKKLLEILNSGRAVSVFNPQLSIIYNIDRVVVTGFNIGQDERFYSKNNISITCVSDDNYDILRPKQVNVN